MINLLANFFFLPSLLQFLEVVRIDGHAFSPEDVALARDMYLLQVDVLTSHIEMGFCNYS